MFALIALAYTSRHCTCELSTVYCEYPVTPGGHWHCSTQ